MGKLWVDDNRVVEWDASIDREGDWGGDSREIRENSWSEGGLWIFH